MTTLTTQIEQNSDDAIVNAGKQVNKYLEDKAPTTKSELQKFTAFVNKSNLALVKDGKQYLLAEAWQYIIDLKKLNIQLSTKSSIEKGVLTVTCNVSLTDDKGNIVSQGVMGATHEEPFLRDKPAYAVYGQAQTRAISRAVRNKFGYIARACGFQACPADELGGEIS